MQTRSPRLGNKNKKAKGPVLNTCHQAPWVSPPKHTTRTETPERATLPYMPHAQYFFLPLNLPGCPLLPISTRQEVVETGTGPPLGWELHKPRIPGSEGKHRESQTPTAKHLFLLADRAVTGNTLHSPNIDSTVLLNLLQLLKRENH